MTIDTERLKTDAKWWDENAPMGATHFNKDRSTWIMQIDHSGWYWDGEWQKYKNQERLELHMSNAEPRPTKPAAPEWDGEEFPVPIGEKCECTFAVEHHDTWHKGEVVFHGIDPEGREYIVVDTGTYQACFRSTDHIRPIRTAEQRQREELSEVVAHASVLKGGAILEEWQYDCIADAVMNFYKERYNLEPKP